MRWPDYLRVVPPEPDATFVNVRWACAERPKRCTKCFTQSCPFNMPGHAGGDGGRAA